MTTVTKRELNQNTAAVLQAVDGANDVIVTERGRSRWRITVATESGSQLDRWEREGIYTPPPAVPAPWPDHPGGPAYTSAEAQRLIDEMKGEH